MKVIDKGPGDKTVIMAVREGLVQPFDAGQWLDLRVGFLLSICGGTDPAGDDVITGLAEDLGGISTSVDKMWIGIRNNGTLFPAAGGVVFIGWTNGELLQIRNTNLISSDIGIGTSNSDYWRARDGVAPYNKFLIGDGAATRSSLPSPIHFVQNYSGGHAAGYATLLMMRLVRPNAILGSPITASISYSLYSGDVLFTSTPTKALLQTNLVSFPTTVQQTPPVTLSAVPDSFFLYWPFSLSRLRIHCAGIEVLA